MPPLSSVSSDLTPGALSGPLCGVQVERDIWDPVIMIRISVLVSTGFD